jgi:hypothetical protein
MRSELTTAPMVVRLRCSAIGPRVASRSAAIAPSWPWVGIWVLPTGAADGDGPGEPDGTAEPDGEAEGAGDGLALGAGDGLADGAADGLADGDAVAEAAALALGATDGLAAADAPADADAEAPGLPLGAGDGMAVGAVARSRATVLTSMNPPPVGSRSLRGRAWRRLPRPGPE